MKAAPAPPSSNSANSRPISATPPSPEISVDTQPAPARESLNLNHPRSTGGIPSSGSRRDRDPHTEAVPSLDGWGPFDHNRSQPDAKPPHPPHSLRHDH